MPRFVPWLAIPVFLVAAVAAWLALDPGFRVGNKAPEPAQMRQDEFEQRVRAYILDNPEVITETITRLQARQRAAKATDGQTVLRARIEDIVRDPASPVGGNPTGDVTLVEFFDYNCPYCRRMAPVMAEAETADRQLRIVYKEFPILGPNSLFAAKAALAAHKQGRYIAFHKALMETSGSVGEHAVLATAGRTGLDTERLRIDMEDTGIADALDRNLELARALRITGTPGFVVGDEIVRGAIDLKTVQELIDKARTAR